MSDLKPVENLPPFTKFCCSIGAIPSSYLESLSYYEMLLWFCNYLQNTVIPSINNNADAVSELQKLYIDLKNYVDNYFTNLNIQQQINNKLDEMAESGYFENILTNYSNLTKVFNTFDELIAQTNLTNNMKVKTLGYHYLNDGGGANYLITSNNEIPGFKVNTQSENLYCVLIDNDNINLKQFGAYGDGIHDDTNALKNAINFLKSLTIKSKALNINSGNYLITSSIELPLYISLISLGNVKFIYSGENEFLHLINNDIIYSGLSQNAYNIRNVLDGSKGVILIQGNGINQNQTAIKIGEDTLGTTHVTHSAWFNITNIYIEKFTNGIYFTNIQNYMQRFYNIVISNCQNGIINSNNSPQNSGEIITFNSCAILNNTNGIVINNIINFNFDNSSIDYNANGIILNYGGYYELNLSNCWLEADNDNLGKNFLIKSNSTSNILTTINCNNCYLYPKNRIPAILFSGKMFLNLKGCTLQANRYTQGNYAEGEFLCDNDVFLNSFDGLNFTDNIMLSSPNDFINENWNFSSGIVGNSSIDGFQFVSGAGSSTVQVSDAKYYTSNKSLQVSNDGTYKTIKSNKFDVSKYKYILGNCLIYLPNNNGQSNGLNITSTITFYDKDDAQISQISIIQNFSYDIENLDKWFLIPQGFTNNNNGAIKVPYNAKSCDISIAFGNIQTTFYIDNIIMTGF